MTQLTADARNAPAQAAQKDSRRAASTRAALGPVFARRIGARRATPGAPALAASAVAIAAALATAAAMSGAAMSGVAWAQDAGEVPFGDVVDFSGEAEGSATLEADEITYDPNTEVVVARGNVEIFYAGRILRAEEVRYDEANDQISAEGEITLINPDGTVIVADEGEFDTEIRNGLIRGARAVLADGRARLAAVEGRRIDGRFTTLSKAVYSPCEACAENPLPLWRIRARRVTRDEEELNIIYEDATFDLLGVPIGYLPVFSHPDPTVKRRSGFLTPSFKRSSEIGVSIKTPYFYEIAPNRDLTITPFIASEELPVGELEYRALEDYGTYTIGGSATYSDDPFDRGFRGHFIGNGEFYAPYNFTLGFDALAATDDTYLRRYGFSNTDRAETTLFAERFTDMGFIDVRVSSLQSFREDEFDGDLPLIAPFSKVEQRVDVPVIGGEAGVFGDVTYLRESSGPDLLRVSSDWFYRRALRSTTGFTLDLTGQVRADVYSINDNPEFGDGLEGRFFPLAAATFGYPLGKWTEGGAYHQIEPIMQVVAAPFGSNNSEIPNEDSQDAEFDDLNLFSLNRFPGRDRFEDGPRASVGLRYTRRPSGGGPTVEATIGQSYRLRENVSFSEESGLNGPVSDVVGSWRIADLPYYAFGHRFRISDGFNFERNEFYAEAKPIDRLRLNASFVFLDADPAASAFDNRAELRTFGEFDLTRHWTVYSGVRRDLELDRFVNADGGIRYSDECIAVDLTLGRRFNSVPDAPASTDVGLKITLKTLGDG